MMSGSCSSIETDRVERQLIPFDMSGPLPEGSGLKGKTVDPAEGILFQPGKEPVRVAIQPGVYVFQGVEVYRRMYADAVAIRAIQESLTPDQRKAFLDARGAAMADIDKDPDQ